MEKNPSVRQRADRPYKRLRRLSTTGTPATRVVIFEAACL
jgi:hypothetical protein